MAQLIIDSANTMRRPLENLILQRSQRIMQASSSNGRASDSKSGCWGFESLLACHTFLGESQSLNIMMNSKKNRIHSRLAGFGVSCLVFGMNYMMR